MCRDSRHPALISSMVPEIIRWQSPVAHMARTATQDCELGGKRIREGDRIIIDPEARSISLDAGDAETASRHFLANYNADKQGARAPHSLEARVNLGAAREEPKQEVMATPDAAERPNSVKSTARVASLST